MKEGFNKNYPKILFVIFLIIWVFLAISPSYRGIWVAENILTILFVSLLVLTYRKFKFSNLSYTLFFILLILHTVGSHYSYTEMPLFNLIRDSLDLTRNHYDRLIHFLFGILFFIPTYEFISRKLRVKGFWGLFLAFFVVTSLKGIYEVLEYAYILVTKSETIGTYFLGMQGDQWDAQKDLFFGVIGSAFTWIGISIKEFLKKRKF
ncbi:hypothetical protein CMI39_00660 [Candidatus Pacearchaeota archaeon]|jgi:putative membrane protein|nr:hypothetical protein [Candidatus Pacearchaeota archaeon]MAH03280.1 hypothetical protein [Candidatus Pacearchaeota archaeon]|tara:strand:+ start:943 stop:1560 length:618 start_codon:yes stop_codon:yes gene_type:complete